MTPQKESLLKVSITHRRNPNMTEEEYHKYWTEVHAPLVAEWLARHGVVKYTQVSWQELSMVGGLQKKEKGGRSSCFRKPRSKPPQQWQTHLRTS